MFCTLNMLKEGGLLRPDSPVKNMTLILGLLRRIQSEWPGDEEEQLSWGDAAIREAKQAGLEFKNAPFGIEDDLKKAKVGEAPQPSDEMWKNFNWNREVSSVQIQARAASTHGQQFTSFSKLVKKVGRKTIGGRDYVLETPRDRKAARAAHTVW